MRNKHLYWEWAFLMPICEAVQKGEIKEGERESFSVMVKRFNTGRYNGSCLI